MNEVTNWTFGETEVRTIERDGEPWWVLKDVCAVLEIKNHKKFLIDWNRMRWVDLSYPTRRTTKKQLK